MQYIVIALILQQLPGFACHQQHTKLFDVGFLAVARLMHQRRQLHACNNIGEHATTFATKQPQKPALFSLRLLVAVA